MKQHFNNYTTEDMEVWQTLFKRQVSNLKTKGSKHYLDCLNQMAPVLSEHSIPYFEDMNHFLMANCGWQIEVVKGLIPVDEFFELLANKRFCSSTWVRSKAQLDYLEEPDMFHDIFGHIPLLLNPQYARFTQRLGQLGVRFKDSPYILTQLQRIYWFTIEFGLILEDGKAKCYGAGLISSFGETNHVFNDDITIEPYNISEVVDQVFTSDEIQNRYRLIDNFDALFESIEALETLFELNYGIRK